MNIEIKAVYDPNEEGFEKFLYRDMDNGRHYQRIVGGLAWPGIKPGFAVILGENLRKDYDLNAHHIRILAEFESLDIEELFKWCVFSHSWFKGEWYLSLENKPMMGLVYNDNRFEHLSIGRAPYSADPKGFRFYVAIFRRHLQSEKKTLHLGENSRLPSYLLELDTKDISTADIDEFPAVAALGYALTTLDLWDSAGRPGW